MAPAAAARPQSTPLLRVVRKVRNFSLSKWVAYHPFTSYFTLAFLFAAWANKKQQQGLKGYIPDYEECIRSGTAKQLGTAKLQEMADVQRYNNMVASMRNDLRGK